MFLTALLCAGCDTPGPNEIDLATFDKAGPIEWDVSASELAPASTITGPYRVVAGDMLSLTIPSMAPNLANPNATDVAIRRVDEDGKIVLPMVGEVAVADKTLTEVEAGVADAYFPKHLVSRPAVVAQVTEYRTVSVMITGDVVTPGRCNLRSDELCMIALLSKAGGILPTGAHVIRITPSGKDAKSVVLPVKGMNTPLVNVALQGGEQVEVAKLRPQTVTVLGLVKAPGSYPVTPDATVNLIQAIGLAGGVDVVTDARYAVIYRQDQQGQVVAARIKLNAVGDDNYFFTDSTLAAVAHTPLKPGDVVMVEHSDHTRLRWTLNRILFFSVGYATSGVTRSSP